MAEILKANILTNLAYFRRSRLLMAFMLVALLLTGLMSLPAIFADSGVQSFNALQQIFLMLNEFLIFFSAGLSLFLISSHLRGRSLKMVFTKPCPPWMWLGSAFLSAVIVSLLLNLAALACAAGLSLIWHVPVRAGLLFISVDSFMASVGMIAYMMLLASFMHPAIAVTFALIFNAGLFYSVQEWTQAVIRSGNSHIGLRVLEKIFHSLYILLPMVHAFDEKTEGIYTSLRVLPSEWKYLLFALGYALALSAFCYTASVYALYRKRYI